MKISLSILNLHEAGCLLYYIQIESLHKLSNKISHNNVE